MSYNVWSREDVKVYGRMKVIGGLVQDHSPDVIFFQEITPYIHSIFESFPWWKDYHCSPVPPEEEKPHFCLMLSRLPLENYACPNFSKTTTGKGYLEADINPEPTATKKPIRIATTQLARPVPPATMHFRERYAQAEHAVSALSGAAANVVFGGDMSWDDDADLPFPLPAGWFDASASNGRKQDWTYDGFWNEKAWEFNGYIASAPWMQTRSDRFVCKLRDYTLKSFQLVGAESIGTRYCVKKHTSYDPGAVDLMPSCHRGLVLTIVPK
ncbi:hypothetical protein BRADI_1g26500v3 [Brachypodium distachyon]|nr:hypothetical protein BRADI_1g26500v3 [Brachypodium distachyon]